MAFVVTTWNVENFGSQQPNFAEKLEHLTKRIRAMKSDVIALQEVLDTAALKALAEKLGYKPVEGEPEANPDHAIRVGFLIRNDTFQGKVVISDWRLPAGVVVHEAEAGGSVRALPRMPRAALRVTVKHNQHEIVLINAHLKSKLLSFPGGRFSTDDESLRATVAYFALQRRAAEAKTLRENISALVKEHSVIMLGDFNDGPEAATTEILYGPAGSQPRGPNDAATPRAPFHLFDAGDEQRLINLAQFVPSEKRWSRKFKGQPELIDHILVSNHFLARSPNGLRRVPEVEIFNDEAESIGDEPRLKGVVPDHAPVTARLVL
jgi:endonuclease/exonuclease/phosphatase family metal-dependent hydrolase